VTPLAAFAPRRLGYSLGLSPKALAATGRDDLYVISRALSSMDATLPRPVAKE